MKSCLLVIDAQQSFRHRPYWDEALASAYLEHQNALIRGCAAHGTALVRIFHSDGPEQPDNPFAQSSGLVRALDGLEAFEASAIFTKHRHSALVDTGLAVWLVQQQIGRLIVSGIRTEQCCETTTRHASDLGWQVDFVTEATLTFDMRQPDGQPLTAQQIRERTATVLDGRFARVCDVAQALAALPA